ncbi:small toxic inner membrane protein TimP [Citrobacter freundii]
MSHGRISKRTSVLAITALSPVVLSWCGLRMDRAMKIRYFCIVLVVSGALCLHGDQSYSGNSARMTLSAQSK